MRSSIRPWLLSLALVSPGVFAQLTVHNDEHLARDRPEAWAMNYVMASTFMTAFGEMRPLDAWHWSIAAELGLIPRLSETQQQVGFNGFKDEDLNKSPVFGRLRLTVGLPAGWFAEFAYSPQLVINGTRPRDLFALAVGHRVLEWRRWTVSMRAFGQHGAAEGDITCPSDVAGIADLQRNSSGCEAPSDDSIALNYYGADVTAAWRFDPWSLYADVGAVRTEPAVQVDARVFTLHDRSRLTARDLLPYVAVGANRDFGTHWTVGAEVLYVPLTVRRDPDLAREQDPFTSVRVQVRYRID
jgi:hypothetical protein